MTGPASPFDKHRDTLEMHETMMGPARGRLAVALDLITDSLALVGQHGVYCRSDRFTVAATASQDSRNWTWPSCSSS